MRVETRAAHHAEHETETLEVKRLKRRIGLKHGLFETGDFVLLILQSVTVILAVFASIPFIFQLFMGVQLNVVLSGSMSGTAEVGDLIQTQPYLGQDLPVGTIVGVEYDGTRYTHRIVEVVTDENSSAVSYVTQGDANNTRDLFKPTNEDIWGVVTNIIPQPLAFSMTMFSWNAQWADSFFNAAHALDFDAISDLLPTAPWGLLVLIVAILLFWWIIPDVLAAIRSKLAKRDELALARLTQHETEEDADDEPMEHTTVAEAEVDLELIEVEEPLPLPIGSARVEDDLSEFLPKVAHVVTLPDLESRPSPRTPASHAREAAQRLLRPVESARQ